LSETRTEARRRLARLENADYISWQVNFLC
jgi:hypothetical protein